MSLSSRKKDFSIFKLDNCKYKTSLICSMKIEKKTYSKFNTAVLKYLSKSAINSYKLNTEKKILNFYNKNQKKLTFITPNGAVVPKKETSKEFNEIIKNFVSIIKKSKSKQNIINFHVPLNIRIKFKKIPNEYFKRDRATEIPHSDCWAGENSSCVNMHIPIFGDVNNNKMEFYHPKKLDEKWLRPLKRFSNGKKYIKNFKKVKYEAKKGYMTISDFGTLHKTIRKKGCGTRISLDTTCELIRENKLNLRKKIHNDRKNEYMEIKKYLKLGSKIKLKFKDSIFNNFIEKKGYKHFANFTLSSNT